jgi:hypothetical protein
MTKFHERAESRSKVAKSWLLAIKPHRFTADLISRVHDFMTPIAEHESYIAAMLNTALSLGTSPSGHISKTLFAMQLSAFVISDLYVDLRDEVDEVTGVKKLCVSSDEHDDADGCVEMEDEEEETDEEEEEAEKQSESHSEDDEEDDDDGNADKGSGDAKAKGPNKERTPKDSAAGKNQSKASQGKATGKAKAKTKDRNGGSIGKGGNTSKRCDDDLKRQRRGGVDEAVRSEDENFDVLDGDGRVVF